MATRQTGARWQRDGGRGETSACLSLLPKPSNERACQRGAGSAAVTISLVSLSLRALPSPLQHETAGEGREGKGKRTRRCASNEEPISMTRRHRGMQIKASVSLTLGLSFPFSPFLRPHAPCPQSIHATNALLLNSLRGLAPNFVCVGAAFTEVAPYLRSTYTPFIAGFGRIRAALGRALTRRPFAKFVQVSATKAHRCVKDDGESLCSNL